MVKLKQELDIFNHLRLLRAAHGITQQELAEAIGVTRATVNAIEKTKHNPSLELAFRLSNYFEKDIHEIFYQGI